MTPGIEKSSSVLLSPKPASVPLSSYPVFPDWAPWVHANLSGRVFSAFAIPGKPGFVALGCKTFWGLVNHNKHSDPLYYGRTFNSFEEAESAIPDFEEAIKNYHDDADRLLNGRR